MEPRATKADPEERKEEQRKRREQARGLRREQAAALVAGDGDGLVRVSVAAALLGVNRVTAWKWVQRSVLPPPIAIGGVRGWRASLLRDLIARGGKA